MSSETTYKCDVCGKKIGGPYGPLHMTAHAPLVSSVMETADLCSFKCAEDWVRDHLPIKIQ